MVWYGDWNQWTWTDNDPMPGWQLDAQEPGIHTIWGCPAAPSNADTTGTGGFWRWRQDVVGNAAWIWRGNDHLGNLVPSGQYILEVAWQGSAMRTIRRSRCLITVSPP
jgi:hypothetical protein